MTLNERKYSGSNEEKTHIASETVSATMTLMLQLSFSTLIRKRQSWDIRKPISSAPRNMPIACGPMNLSGWAWTVARENGLLIARACGRRCSGRRWSPMAQVPIRRRRLCELQR